MKIDIRSGAALAGQNPAWRRFGTTIISQVARIRVGVRQCELAARLGMPPSRLSEIEVGRRKLTPELLRQILKILAAQPNKLQN